MKTMQVILYTLLGTLGVAGLIFAYHTFVVMPMFDKDKTLYVVNSQKLIGEYEQKIKDAVLNRDMDTAEALKKEFVERLDGYQEIVNQFSRRVNAPVFVREAVVGSHKTIDITESVMSYGEEKAK